MSFRLVPPLSRVSLAPFRSRYNSVRWQPGRALSTVMPSRPAVAPTLTTAFGELDEATKVRRSMIIDEVKKAEAKRGDLVRLSFTVFNEKGDITHPHLNFTKAELCSRFQLHARDVRPLDSNNTLSAGIYHGRQNLVATILPRRGHCIVLNLLYIRALILADEVILFDSAEGPGSQLHSAFRAHLERHLRDRAPGEPFSYAVLESFLSSTAGTLEAEMALLRSEIIGLIANLQGNITRSSLNQLSSVARDLGGLGERAKLVNDAVERCLADDDLMVLMNLTKPPPPATAPAPASSSSIPDQDSTCQTVAFSPSKPSTAEALMRSRQEEAELLFESFSQRIEEITSEIQTSNSNVHSTKEVVDLMMGATRNGLITLDLQLNYITVVTGFGTLIAGLFGMNLMSGFEEHPTMFYMITGWIALGCVTLTALGIRRIHYIKRVGLGSLRAPSSPPTEEGVRRIL
ncbi:Magnesium transporters: CorA family [Phaffia rhodozyma]|uniref:Magnesium transporter n=1 Tax=Phaffia rhodozyma TaxID=264483 RepID=A0A0F7SMX8_PHARH|nr:Magnesium transporters: CorA family [Phaffia rhodozyma]